MWMNEAIDWVPLISAILGSSITASLMTHWLSNRKETASRDRVAAYLAIKLARLFERFAEASLNTIDSMERYSASRGSDGERALSMPKIDELPEDDDGWTDLPTSLVARIIDFEPNLASIEEHIRDTFDVVGPEEGVHVVETNCVEMGNKALDIAASLRARYNIPQRELKWDWIESLRGLRGRKLKFRNLY